MKSCSCSWALPSWAGLRSKTSCNPSCIVCVNLPLQSMVFMNPHRIQSILMQLHCSLNSWGKMRTLRKFIFSKVLSIITVDDDLPSQSDTGSVCLRYLLWTARVQRMSCKRHRENWRSVWKIPLWWGCPCSLCVISRTWQKQNQSTRLVKECAVYLNTSVLKLQWLSKSIWPAFRRIFLCLTSQMEPYHAVNTFTQCCCNAK